MGSIFRVYFCSTCHNYGLTKIFLFVCLFGFGLGVGFFVFVFVLFCWFFSFFGGGGIFSDISAWKQLCRSMETSLMLCFVYY